MSNLLSQDPEIAAALENERKRQIDEVVLIASENYASAAVLEATGSVMTNKYAEGYPGRRYYAGCENMDIVEQAAIDRLKALFGADHANVQPVSGAQANMAAYFALLKPGDRVMGMSLDQGGHLTHGSEVNFSGKLYEFAHYGVDPESETNRLRRGGSPGCRVSTETDRGRGYGLPAPDRLRTVSRNRRRGRRPSPRRHVSHCRPDSRRRPPGSSPVFGRGDEYDT